MDPNKFHPDCRPGSRKPWDLLSDNHKRKIKKQYYDSFDASLNCNERCSTKSNVVFPIINNSSSCKLLVLTKNGSESRIGEENSSIIQEENVTEKPIEERSLSEMQDTSNDTFAKDDRQSSLHLLGLPSNLNDKVSRNKNINMQGLFTYTAPDESCSTLDTNNIVEQEPKNIESIAQTLKAHLAKCFVENKLNQVQSNAVLKVVRLHPQLRFLPQDCRSLLKTPRDKITVKEVAPGEYLHLGLEKMLQSILNRV